jgi:tetratricopeptide (TPR) repeat protein
MATRISVRRILLLSLAISIAIPATSGIAFADEQAATPAAPAATPATAVEPAPAPATPSPAAAPEVTPAPTPVAATPAPTPVATPAPAPSTPSAEPPQLNSSDRNLTAPAPEIKPRKPERKSSIKKKDNFEQMERHEGDGYYNSIIKAPEKGANFEQQERHGEGYYVDVKATPKEYPKEPTPPVYVPPTPPPAAVLPVTPRNPGEPERKFDDDTGSSGSITFTRHLKTANEMLASGHNDLAKKHYKEAIHVQPENAETYPGYIESCQKTNDWSETQHGIERYLQMKPEKEREYSWQLGESLFHLQKYDKAVPVLKKSLAYGHHQEQIHRMLLKVAQIQNDNPEVIAEYNALCKVKPNDYQTHMDFAVLLERLSKPQEAITQYRAATNANPTDGRTMGRLAYLMMFHNKDYDGAIGCYNKAMAADPTNAKSYQDGIAYCMQQKQLASQPKTKKKN